MKYGSGTIQGANIEWMVLHVSPSLPDMDVATAEEDLTATVEWEFLQGKYEILWESKSSKFAENVTMAILNCSMNKEF